MQRCMVQRCVLHWTAWTSSSSTGRSDARTLANLEEHAAALPSVGPSTPRLVYGRRGCAPSLAGEPGVGCFSAADLYE